MTGKDKKDVRREESFILSIYNMRNNTNEIVLLLPIILAFAFSLIGAPVIGVCCDISAFWIVVLICAPVLCVILYYFIRKRRIINNFIKIKDISGRVELTDVRPDDLESAASGEVLMFPYSEYMKTILYNWFHSLNVIGDGKLKMAKVTYESIDVAYLAVCESDLDIPEGSVENYKKETFNNVRLSDMVDGRVVNQKLYERLSKRTR